jgi:hypothetical protein
VTFSGTHQGEFVGVPASGNQVEWSAIDILQFRDGKAVDWARVECPLTTRRGSSGRTVGTPGGEGAGVGAGSEWAAVVSHGRGRGLG